MPDSLALEKLKGGLIVSCQSEPGDSTDSPVCIAGFALAAERGGAVGLRLNGAEHIAVVRAATRLPIIGIQKGPGVGSETRVLITGSAADIPPLIEAGADIVAFDALDRARHSPLVEIVQTIHAGGALAMADISAFEDAERAAARGVDIIGTTLSVWRQPAYVPDIDLIARLVAAFDLPVIAEGNFWEPADVTRALEAGAYAVVVGSAITRPWLITERYVKAIP
ncbi:MAG: putative N-acetylmannosamine-6-phosphate 2-epimerase [Anaerolineae bacterium]|nr:putative N-acetylmannosamine-6-phosphate 2-epimerase [Anaerolineae bacterium]